MELKIINGNNIDILKTYPDNYFDAVVTDPPYGLGKELNAEALMKDWIEHGYHEILGSGFMGKEWDAFVPQPVFWKEVYRVLKHGGHVLSFFGTRTYDWGVMSMRFAGFEVRDCIQWLYGSGFPKSHNISKALDKMGGESLDWFIEYILEVAKERGISKKELTMLFPSKNGNPTGWLWNKQNNQSITLEQYNTIKDYLNLPFENIEEAKREVIGKGKAGLTKGDIANFSGETEFDITAPATEAAKQWDGWGTALKPANEPIVLARKPLEKGLSIAENILKWGVGGINIDATRIGVSENDPNHRPNWENHTTEKKGDVYGVYEKRKAETLTQGRFPANIILTHHEDCECKGTKKVKPSNGSGKASGTNNKFNKGVFQDENREGKFIEGGFTDADGNETIEDWDCHEDCPIRILDEQSGILKSGAMDSIAKGGKYNVYSKMNERRVVNPASQGGASRFFYVAKASKAERNKGLDAFDVKRMEGRDEGQDERSVAFKARPTPMANVHPTVKPIKLMQYLVKMITPPNGIVLDPFCGSGTTGVACKLDGFSFVGLEQDPEYTKIAEARIENYIDKEKPNNKKDQLSLF
jgi:DNA modification methylase